MRDTFQCFIPLILKLIIAYLLKNESYYYTCIYIVFIYIYIYLYKYIAFIP